MRNISIAFSSLLLICFIAFSGCNQNQPKGTGATASTPINTGAPATGKIAYVNIDTLEAKYELLKAKREEFKHRQEVMESELQRSYQQMQSDAQQVQKKAEANTLTQSEYEAAQKRLSQMQQSLQTRKETLTNELVKQQEDFNKDLKTRLDEFLDEYNKTHHYDYILSYSYAGSSLLYVNKQLDITKDVVDGMNAKAKSAENKKN
jgi:outer membrane protein